MPKIAERGRREARLARLLEAPHLERIVPHLAPETLHQLIQYRGLEACGPLVASMAPAQLASVLDLDVWRRRTPAGDDLLDAARFGDWIAALVELGDGEAARIVAGIDARLVVAGLSRHIRVFDHAVRSGGWSWDGDEMGVGDGANADLSSDVGGYAVCARRTDAWDPIVTLLLALDACHPDYFHAVMGGCRRLSDSGREIDGLDALLEEPQQLLHDVSGDRQDRRSQQGYLAPAEARAFLEAARRGPIGCGDGRSPINPIAAAHLSARHADRDTVASSAPGQNSEADADGDDRNRQAIEDLVAVLADAGLVGDRPRALLGSGAHATSPGARMEPLQSEMERVLGADEVVYRERNRELAFLANALMAGCSVHARPFSVAEASDAAVATCNLGLERLRAERPGPSAALLLDCPLITAFEVGWAALHDASMFVAQRLVTMLREVRCRDRETQEGLDALRRELARQRAAGTPWRARDALDVIATLDVATWAGLLGALDECPLLPAALTAVLERRTGAVSATAFQFISTRRQLDQLGAFAGRLREIVIGTPGAEG